MVNSSSCPLPIINDKPSYSLKHFELPSLTVNFKNHSSYVPVMTYFAMRNPKTHSPEPTNRKVVGRIENDQKFGRVIFKESFIQEYPQLRKLTIYRQGNHNFVAIEQPYDGPSYEDVKKRRGRPPHAKQVSPEVSKTEISTVEDIQTKTCTLSKNDRAESYAH